MSLDHKLRFGNFTSSEVYKLMPTATGKVSATRGTYIKEKQIERRLKRSLDLSTKTQPMKWGKFCERRVIQLMGTSYASCGEVTLHHPNKELPWAGSPDSECKKEDVGVEVKCYEPKHFAEWNDALDVAKKESS